MSDNIQKSLRIGTIRKETKKINTFKDWLVYRGCEILPSTNNFELIRFNCVNGIGLVYKNQSNHLTLVGSAISAWKSFTNNTSWELYQKPKNTRSFKIPSRVQALIDRDGCLCFFCGEEMCYEDMSIEHLVAKNFRGPNHLANLVLAHGKCNADAGPLSAREKIEIHVQWRLKKC